MTTIKDWLGLNISERGLNYDYETAIRERWPFIIVEDLTRASSDPAFPYSEKHLPEDVMQRAIRKIQKAAQADEFYVIVMPTRADNNQFLIGATKKEELELITNGFANHKRFKVV